MEQVAGTYDGEGSNASGGVAVPAPINAAPPGTANGPMTPQQTVDQAKKATGRTDPVAMTRVRQLRVSSEAARSSAALNVGGGDQVLTNVARGFLCTTSGNLVCRFIDDTADQTIALTAGNIYPFMIALIRQTGTTVAGTLLF
jgi:hypothetical protein